MSVTWLRVMVAILLAGAVLVASVPLLVLLDLADGGSGYGLCPNGIQTCRNPYTAAPELSLFLTVALFTLVAGIRIAMRTVRRLERREAAVAKAPGRVGQQP